MNKLAFLKAVPGHISSIKAVKILICEGVTVKADSLFVSFKALRSS